MLGVAVVFFASSIAFLLIHSLPGDPFGDLAANPNVSPQAAVRYRTRYVSSEPVEAQLWQWVKDVARGDLQYSTYGDKPVATLIGEHLPATLQLMTLAFITGMIGGVALGTWQGANAESGAERAAGRIGLGIISIPDFWLAIMLIWIFAVKLHWFPSQGMKDPAGDGSLLDRLHYIVLPWLSLTLVDIAVVARFQRASMTDVMQMQHLRTARAKGVPEKGIKWRHALRVAVLPTITIGGLYFPALVVGAVLIETVFGWPGIGQLLTQAIEKRDYFLVSGIVVVGSAMTALGSLLADVTRELADPRLRA